MKVHLHLNLLVTCLLLGLSVLRFNPTNAAAVNGMRVLSSFSLRGYGTSSHGSHNTYAGAGHLTGGGGAPSPYSISSTFDDQPLKSFDSPLQSESGVDEEKSDEDEPTTGDGVTLQDVDEMAAGTSVPSEGSAVTIEPPTEVTPTEETKKKRKKPNHRRVYYEPLAAFPSRKVTVRFPKLSHV